MPTPKYGDLPAYVQDIVDAANAVVSAWETGDLAGAVNYLDATLQDYMLRCTSDDPTNHQGDTCPVHEAVRHA